MIKEENFIQMQFTAKEKYMNSTGNRYNTEGEVQAASNSYIQGRVDAVADMEGLVTQHNLLVKERNKLAKELADIKGKPSMKIISPPISGVKKGKEGYCQIIPDEGLGL